jgi:hypothetical protein
MSDDDPTPAGAAPAADPWPSARSGEADTFDLLGSEIAALLRSTHEISDRTRLEAEADAAARLADADLQAAQRLAEAEARLADVHRQAEQRLAETDRQVEERLAAIIGREEAALAVFELATELVKRLEQRLTRVAAECRAANSDLAPLKAALKRGQASAAATPTPATPESTPDAAAEPAPDDGTTIDLRDPTEPLPKRKGKHKRRRKQSDPGLPALAGS